MAQLKKDNPIITIGKPTSQGIYILVIRLEKDEKIKVGKLNQQNPILFKKGYYVYIGSAMGKKKSSASLPYRLIRHTNRKKGKKHEIQKVLKETFQKMSLIIPEKENTKNLRWHIDFLLENKNTVIERIYILFINEKELEEKISLKINKNNKFCIIHKGLGSSDLKAPTTLLRSCTDKTLLYEEIEKIIQEELKL